MRIDNVVFSLFPFLQIAFFNFELHLNQNKLSNTHYICCKCIFISSKSTFYMSQINMFKLLTLTIGVFFLLHLLNLKMFHIVLTSGNSDFWGLWAKSAENQKLTHGFVWLSYRKIPASGSCPLDTTTVWVLFPITTALVPKCSFMYISTS